MEKQKGKVPEHLRRLSLPKSAACGILEGSNHHFKIPASSGVSRAIFQTRLRTGRTEEDHAIGILYGKWEEINVGKMLKMPA